MYKVYFLYKGMPLGKVFKTSVLPRIGDRVCLEDLHLEFDEHELYCVENVLIQYRKRDKSTVIMIHLKEV